MTSTGIYEMDQNERVEYVTPNDLFWKVRGSARQQTKDWKDNINHTIVALDPGETTGVAIRPMSLDKDTRILLRQMDTKHLESGATDIGMLLSTLKAQSLAIQLVCEDYKVYSWKSEEHKWSGVHTLQLIGAIRLIAHQLQIPILFQMAYVGKTFVTDNKLMQWDLYSKGLKHARDAERHLLHHLIFGT
jgi:hypothetical protein